jgi:hypothetical protein
MFKHSVVNTKRKQNAFPLKDELVKIDQEHEKCSMWWEFCDTGIYSVYQK